MIYPGNFEEKIGFDVLRNLLMQKCLGEAGRKRVQEISFSSDFDLIKQKLSLLGEFREMLITVPGFPMSDYDDLDNELARIRTAGTYMFAETILQLRHSLTVTAEILHFVRSTDAASFPNILQLCDGIYADERVLAEITRIMNDHGEIRDTASEKLFTIRKSIAGLKSQIDRRIAQSLSQAKTQGWISDEANITIRNGRLVIPVPAANKKRVKGFIHDQSATGQTVYIEPAEVFEMNNDIRQFELSEQQEIIRILTQFTDLIRPSIPQLLAMTEFIGQVDFLRASTMFALETGSVKPLISGNQVIDWKDARHPLLLLSHKRQNKTVVPLDISLNGDNRILVISGPNAGGKSVCLKTVGLLQYMLQCGLLIPVRETSEAGIFSNIFIDIGDQQSIDNDLSTYSSHLINVKNLLSFAGKETLFLIDEFGAGTEPQSGGAIAETVLERLNDQKAYGVVTTHYANLKVLAAKSPGMINGAMMFDTRRMQPLFKLVAGKPGSSFAFEIAANIQFPGEILSAASEKAGTSQLNYDKLMQELENERIEIALKEKQLQRADELLASMINKYNTLNTELEHKKKLIIENARSEAQRIIGESNTLIEKTIRDIKQVQAEKARTRKIRLDMQSKAEELIIQGEDTKTPIPDIYSEDNHEVIKNASPDVGDTVKIIGQSEIGNIEELGANEALVAFNTVKLRVPLSKLVVLTGEGKLRGSGKPYDYKYHKIVNDINARLANFKLSIDVRGYRGEEAVALIQKYIDEAILLNVSEVSILHGKGNGILRRMIRDYLHSVPEVRQMNDEILERGGAGITVVRFK